MTPPYIDPTLHIHSTFAAAKDFYDTFGTYHFWSGKTPATVAQVAQGKRNLIVGEPGIGKTELLKHIEDHLKKDGVATCRIALKEADAATKIVEFLNTNESQTRALLLDGLDEVQASRFPAVLEKIQYISQARSDLSLYLSSRWVFLNRYAADFSEYRFITIAPFTRQQVREYLTAANHPPAAVDTFLTRLMAYRQNTVVIQIPRYLALLTELLKKEQMASISNLSRNQLFEYFIYAKLDLEGKQLNVDNAAITKRLLEKLALTMEIYQTNTITKDELMTVLDDLQSDLKLAALTQLKLQDLFDKSLLKDNHDSIEFDNTEFQEYLAAKEITRFPDPRRAAFVFAVDQQLNEFQPSWFSTLTFLLDMQPELLEQVIEFSGIRGTRVIDDEFLQFLSRITPDNVPPGLKTKLFHDLLAYHQRHLQWVPVALSAALPGLYEASHEMLLKQEVTQVEKQTGSKRYIRLGNIALIVGHLLNAGASLDQQYWRKHLLDFATDKNDNGVLQRHALFALGHLGDPSIINQLPASLLEGDELIGRAFLGLCTRLSPDSPQSLQYFIQATVTGTIEARYGLYAIKAKDALIRFLETFNTNESFRRAFLDQGTIFKDQDQVLVEHIRSVWDNDVTRHCEQAIVHSLDYAVAPDGQRSTFIHSLAKVLKDHRQDIFPAIIDAIRASQVKLYYAVPLFAALVENTIDLTQTKNPRVSRRSPKHSVKSPTSGSKSSTAA